MATIKEELKNWIFQFGRSNSEKMGLRTPPYVFTEHGILMLSSILKSKIAIQINIQIMQIFTQMRQIALTNKEIMLKLSEIEQKLLKNDRQFEVVFEAIHHMFQIDQKEKKFGFIN